MNTQISGISLKIRQSKPALLYGSNQLEAIGVCLPGPVLSKSSEPYLGHIVSLYYLSGLAGIYVSESCSPMLSWLHRCLMFPSTISSGLLGSTVGIVSCFIKNFITSCKIDVISVFLMGKLKLMDKSCTILYN